MGDFRFALRSLRKSPGSAAVAVLTLAIAVGGATAIFSVLNAVVLRPLPYPKSDQLVVIRDSFMPKLPVFSVSPGRFLAWQSRTRAFAEVAAARNSSGNLTGTGDPQRLQIARVSSNLFALLGVHTLTGRTFTAGEDTPGGSNVIVLSEALWQGRFAGAADIVGRTLVIDDKPTVVIGVMPATFTYPNLATQAWMPMAFTDSERRLYGSHYLQCIARIKDGVTFEAARADLAEASRQIEPIDSGNTGWTTLIDPMLELTVRNVKSGLWILSGGVGVLLLIACANIANLLLARGVGRQRELGVRAALGATRGRLVRQMIIENLVLGGLGSSLGLALAWGILKAVVASPTTNLPRSGTIALDPATLFFALALALLTPLVFGLIPAIQISRTDLRELLSQGGRSGGSAMRTRTRAALIVAEVALAVMLVAGSTLLIRSFARLMDVPPGFDTDRQLIIGLSLPGTRYATNDSHEAFWTTLSERVSQLPGVEAAAVTQSVPLINDFVSTLEIPGKTPPEQVNQPSTNFYAVSPSFFKAMGIPIVRGRGVDPADGPKTERVAVISQGIASKYFGTEDPIDKQVRVSQGPSRDFARVIGVAGDIKQYGLDSQTTLQVYEPARQHSYFSSMQLIVRTPAQPEAMTASLRQLLKELDPSLPIATARTLKVVVAASVGPRQFTTTLLTSFAGVALLLAAIGVYGLVSFTVGQRTQEIGIRMALGAQARGVLGLVFGQGLGLTVVGVALGVGGGLVAGRLLQSELFGVSARDPIAFGIAPAILILAAALACYWPARRALKVNPVTALRQ